MKNIYLPLLMGVLCLCTTSLLAQNNNTCAAAYNLNAAGGVPSALPASTCGMTQSTIALTGDIDHRNNSASGTLPAPSGCSYSSNREDAWYRVTMPGNATAFNFAYDEYGCSGFLCATDMNWQVYSGSCGGLTKVGGCGNSDDDVFVRNLTPGATYFIRFWEDDNQGFRLRDFFIEFGNETCDDCVTGMPLPQTAEFVCGGAQSVTNLNMDIDVTDDLQATESSNSVAGITCDIQGTNPEDIWIEYTIPANTGGVAIQFENNGGCQGTLCQTNITYSWYTTTNGCAGLEYRGCGAVSCFLGCNDGAINVSGEPGETVYVRIWEEDDQGFSITINQVTPTAPADLCYTALELSSTGCNYQASAPATGLYAEPDTDTWNQNAHPDLNPETCADCICQDGDGDGSGSPNGTNSLWLSNETLVWYTFTHDGGDFFLQADDVACTAGVGTLQMGVFSVPNTGDLCDFNGSGTNGVQGFGCSVGVGTVAIDIAALPAGDYVLLVDGNAGAECQWIFKDEAGNPLPVELTSFKAYYNDNKKSVELTWVTESEIDNEGFEVLRSTDGKEFEEIGFVNGMLNPDGYTYYFEDNNYPNTEIIYYRLKQVDFDGSFTLSNITAVSVDYVKEGFAVLSEIYPNPARGNELNIPFYVTQETTVNIHLMDMSGRLVLNIAQNEPYSEGRHKVQAGVSQLSPGMYIVRFMAGNKIYNRKLMIQ